MGIIRSVHINCPRDRHLDGLFNGHSIFLSYRFFEILRRPIAAIGILISFRLIIDQTSCRSRFCLPRLGFLKKSFHLIEIIFSIIS